MGTARRAAAVGVSTAGGAALGGLVSIGTATYFARKVITPEREKKDDTLVLGHDEEAGTVSLRLAEHTAARGRYGLWLDGGAGHARLGEVVGTDTHGRRASGHTVTREVHGIDAGTLAPGPARWNTYYYYGDPERAIGLAYQDVLVPSDLGDLPAWQVPADPGNDRGEWAVCVHGRSAQREETLRALPVLHRLGYTSLVPTYRNDDGAPPSVDGRYGLGLQEWHDIDAAIGYAVGQGARRIVLVGYSMGGAVVLQALHGSVWAHRVRRVLLDCPVIDWGAVLAHHAELNYIPAPLDHLARRLMGHRWSRFFVGVAEPLDIAATNWVDRADEMSHRMLIIHSTTDPVVPFGPSGALAKQRPGLVETYPWPQARHCGEWNTDPPLWERLVSDFLG